jgi:Cu/Ag efflux protein CusF
MKSYSGTVTAVDPSARSITVRKALISHTFQVSGDAVSNLSGIKVGDEVNVDYRETGGEKLAHRVSPAPRAGAQQDQNRY